MYLTMYSNVNQPTKTASATANMTCSSSSDDPRFALSPFFCGLEMATKLLFEKCNLSPNISGKRRRKMAFFLRKHFVGSTTAKTSASWDVECLACAHLAIEYCESNRSKALIFEDMPYSSKTVVKADCSLHDHWTLLTTWNIGRVEMIRESVEATTNKHDTTATIWS